MCAELSQPSSVSHEPHVPCMSSPWYHYYIIYCIKIFNPLKMVSYPTAFQVTESCIIVLQKKKIGIVKFIKVTNIA